MGLGGGVLAHVVKDGPLRAGRHDRLADALDPHPRTAPAAALVTAQRLQGVDLVGADELAESQEDHPRLTGHHEPIMAGNLLTHSQRVG